MADGGENAGLYIPGGEDGMASIHLGRGDGKVMQNLETDADVVSHLLAHFILFRRVTDLSSHDAMIVHEGLADGLTILRNDDPCVAHTICVAGGRSCVEEQRCLRSAANDYTLDDPRWPAPFSAARSQALSGWPWDLRRSGQVEPVDLARLVVAAIAELGAAAAPKDVVAALRHADQVATGGKLDALITAAAAARHLD